MNIFETLSGYFQFPFVRYALIAGVLIALCSSLLGVTLVLKRFSFIGDGLSHVAFGAMAIATVISVSNDMLIVMPVTILSAILLLDEPVSGLDPSATAEMYAIIRRLNREEGITVLMISHDIFAATREADHILHLAHRPLFFGSTEDYRKSDVGRAFLRMEEGERA